MLSVISYNIPMSYNFSSEVKYTVNGGKIEICCSALVQTFTFKLNPTRLVGEGATNWSPKQYLVSLTAASQPNTRNITHP
jgi:hypothetical protein